MYLCAYVLMHVFIKICYFEIYYFNEFTEFTEFAEFAEFTEFTEFIQFAGKSLYNYNKRLD